MCNLTHKSVSACLSTTETIKFLMQKISVLVKMWLFTYMYVQHRRLGFLQTVSVMVNKWAEARH